MPSPVQDWRNHLTAVKADINPEFVRFHGLLDDDMSVVLGPGDYSFFNVSAQPPVSVHRRPAPHTRTHAPPLRPMRTHPTHYPRDGMKAV